MNMLMQIGCICIRMHTHMNVLLSFVYYMLVRLFACVCSAVAYKYLIIVVKNSQGNTHTHASTFTLTHIISTMQIRICMSFYINAAVLLVKMLPLFLAYNQLHSGFFTAICRFPFVIHTYKHTSIYIISIFFYECVLLAFNLLLSQLPLASFTAFFVVFLVIL